jgi:Acyclic terpene utilisation family protein AtuA
LVQRYLVSPIYISPSGYIDTHQALQLHRYLTRIVIITMAVTKQQLRVGNVSGATGDSPTAMSRMARDGNVNVLVGDWLSEMNIAWNAISKSQDPKSGYEFGFLSQLTDCLDDIVERDIKVITNAGALNTPSLAKEVAMLCEQKGHGHVIVAQVLGDDISSLVTNHPDSLGLHHHLDHEDWHLRNWQLEPHCGVAYIGAWGIVEALKAGAQIIICGRVTDASPVIGAAAWWYHWQKDDWDKLAGALVAGRMCIQYKR